MSVREVHGPADWSFIKQTINNEVLRAAKAFKKLENPETHRKLMRALAKSVVQQARENIRSQVFIWRGHLKDDWSIENIEKNGVAICNQAPYIEPLEFGYIPHLVRADADTGYGETIGDWYISSPWAKPEKVQRIMENPHNVVIKVGYQVRTGMYTYAMDNKGKVDITKRTYEPTGGIRKHEPREGIGYFLNPALRTVMDEFKEVFEGEWNISWKVAFNDL